MVVVRHLGIVMMLLKIIPSRAFGNIMRVWMFHWNELLSFEDINIFIFPQIA